MNVSKLMEALEAFDPDAPVVFDAHWFGLEVDGFEVDSVHQFEGEIAVRLLPGEAWLEEE